ncbi:unnamed protein product [Paramecium sonneborni]|uniref:RING-type domain-containing protein n=1 Tax=Paramecium sonneborni TaxID=65129 RepID=A0A8S1PZY1_9CILI|nr:unnamed protein product [Paramecium sonneborni]
MFEYKNQLLDYQFDRLPKDIYNFVANLIEKKQNEIVIFYEESLLQDNQFFRKTKPNDIQILQVFSIKEIIEKLADFDKVEKQNKRYNEELTQIKKEIINLQNTIQERNKTIAQQKIQLELNENESNQKNQIEEQNKRYFEELTQKKKEIINLQNIIQERDKNIEQQKIQLESQENVRHQKKQVEKNLVESITQTASNYENIEQQQYHIQNLIEQLQQQIDILKKKQSSIIDFQVSITFSQICYFCQQNIDDDCIMISCQHSFHHDCLIHLVESQCYLNQPKLKCLCQKSIKPQLLKLIHDTTKAQILKLKLDLNQLNYIKSVYPQKFLNCQNKNCNFFYYYDEKQQRNSSFCPQCLM